MSLEDKLKATAKNIEGKLEAAAGEITGDPEMQAKGKAKQMQAKTQQGIENLKDQAKKLLD
jgi:uncharacterized protein YjbJ (UPF0337 family)